MDILVVSVLWTIVVSIKEVCALELRSLAFSLKPRTMKRNMGSAFGGGGGGGGGGAVVAPSPSGSVKRRLNPQTPGQQQQQQQQQASVLSPSGRSVGNNQRARGCLLDIRKIYNDPIHQTILMDGLSQCIIDTCEYQRLAQLKQLGTCCYVFRGATHTRFEHSLGVAHLAERVVRKLQDNQPHLDITDVDILCVKIAGLCHDLGHGPFSHVYDGVFIPKVRAGKPGPKWRHEDGSVAMLRLLLANNGIDLAAFGLSQRDQTFIEEIIGGTKEDVRTGRGKEKSYLYDIVNNIRSGMDVDKLDYFQRDMRYTNVTFAANFERFIELGRVIRATPLDYTPPSFGARVLGLGTVSAPASSSSSSSAMQQFEDTSAFPFMICYPEKMVTECVDMFAVRFRMHKQVYTHKAVKQCEFMITDALEAADDYILIRGAVTEAHPDGLYRMSECVESMEALARLNDNILEVIRQDQRPELARAQAILARLERRRLYVCLGKSAFRRSDRIATISERAIRAEIVAIAQRLVDGTYEHPLHGGGDDDFDADEDEDGGDGHGHGHGHGRRGGGFASLDPAGAFSNLSQMSNASTQSLPGGLSLTPVPLSEEDLIVEKMHIHYGLKDKNPVARMRFYQRKAEVDAVGREVKEGAYVTSLPAVFEEQAVRVFCRSEARDVKATALQAYVLWCREVRCPTPFPSLSQTAAGIGLGEGEGEGDDGYD